MRHVKPDGTAFKHSGNQGNSCGSLDFDQERAGTLKEVRQQKEVITSQPRATPGEATGAEGGETPQEGTDLRGNSPLSPLSAERQEWETFHDLQFGKQGP